MKRNQFLKMMGLFPFLLGSVKQDKTAILSKEEVTFFTPEMLSRNNFGLFVINSKVKEVTFKNLGYAATVAWKLTYHNQTLVNTLQGKITARFDFPRYMKTNFLTDGWSYPIGHNYEEVCNFLNNNEHGEKFRLMTKEEVLFIISNRNQGFL